MHVLIFTNHFYPAYKAGGVLKAVVNFVGTLYEDMTITVVTSDRDLGDKKSFKSIPLNTFTQVGGAEVMYIKQSPFAIFTFLKVLRKQNYDVLYLNEAFNPYFTIVPLLFRRLSLIPDKPVILEPHGVFSKGALNIKKRKKNLFIWVANIVGLFKEVNWQATSDMEAAEMRDALGNKMCQKITVVPYLLSCKDVRIRLQKESVFLDRSEGPLRLVYLSRIVRKKNLYGAIKLLKSVTQKVTFDIYGPIEEKSYWERCVSLIRELPSNVEANYKGDVIPEEVLNTFSKYDLFLFPTHGENYGHVIYEALSAGTSVLLSDQTPWTNSGNSALKVISLDATDLWKEEMIKWSKKNQDDLVRCRKQVGEFITDYRIHHNSERKTIDFFSKVSHQYNN